MKMINFKRFTLFFFLQILFLNLYGQIKENALQRVPLQEAINGYQSSHNAIHKDINQTAPINGQQYFLSYPLDYLGFAVSRYCHQRSFKNGEMVEDKRIHTLSKGYANEPFGEVQVDGKWWKNIRQEEILLTHDVNRLYKSIHGTPLRPSEVKQYDLLIKQNTNHTYSIHVLKPTTLSSFDQKVINRLQKVFKKLDKDCLFVLYTNDGRLFPYRYMHASYLLSCTWNFVDILNEKQQ